MKNYYINFNKAVPSWTQFYPNEGTEATNKRPESQEFYREEVSEIKIVRQGPGRSDGDNVTVYDTLESWFTDDTKFGDEIEIEIYNGTMGGGTLYFAGFFSVSDGTIDKVNKIFKFTPRIDDEYREIFTLRDTKYDVRTNALANQRILSQAEVVNPTLTDISSWGAGPGIFDDFTTFMVGANNNILTSVIDSDAGNIQARAAGFASGPNNGDIVVAYVKSFTLNSGTAPYIDVYNVGGTLSATNEGGQQITATGNYVWHINVAPDTVYLYTSPANQVCNFSMEIYFYVAAGETVNSGRKYMDFIEDFIAADADFMFITGLQNKIKSTYINNDALPSDAPSSIDTFITNNPNGNYVTEVTASNSLNGFLISETLNWVTADVTQTKVSLIELMSDLMNTIQAGWYIDADGDFRIEHVKYFEKLVDDSTAVDLTSAPFDKYKAEVNFTELNYDKSVVANREQFEMQQQGQFDDSEDFLGTDIIYENLETIENVFRHEPRTVTTDMDYLNANPDDAAASGFTYLLTVLSTGDGTDDYVIQVEDGILTGDNKLNGHFSWANLQDKYWKWRRMSENGDMNDGDTTTFDSAVKFLEQSGIKFGLETALDGFTKITTSQGTGQQIETVRNLDTDFLTVLISFNPYV